MNRASSAASYGKLLSNLKRQAWTSTCSIMMRKHQRLIEGSGLLTGRSLDLTVDGVPLEEGVVLFELEATRGCSLVLHSAQGVGERHLQRL